MSPGRAEAHAEDARRVDTPVGPQLSPPRHRTQPPRLCRSQPRIHLSSEPPFLSRPALVRRTNRPQPTHTCFRRANIPGDRELHCVTLISSSSPPCHRGQASEHARPRGSLGCSAPFFTVVNRPVPASHPRGVVFDVVLFAMGFQSSGSPRLMASITSAPQLANVGLQVSPQLANVGLQVIDPSVDVLEAGVDVVEAGVGRARPDGRARRRSRRPRRALRTGRPKTCPDVTTYRGISARNAVQGWRSAARKSNVPLDRGCR